MSRKPRTRTVDWDWNEFLFDGRVGAMDSACLGIWTRLLGAFALSEEPGVILGDDEVLRRFSGATQVEWERYRDQILAGLKPVPGGWSHDRTRRDHRKITRKLIQYRVASAKANRSRWQRDKSGSDTDRRKTGLPPSLLHSFTPDSKPNTLGQLTLTGSVGSPAARNGEGHESPDQWSQGFDWFWSEYPRKVAKEAARKAYMRLTPRTQATYDLLMDGLRHHVATEWAKRDPDKIPHAATWLTQRRFTDAEAAQQ